MKVVYRDEDHTYWDEHSGKQVPGVSRVIRAAGYGRSLGHIDPAVLENARRRGVAVHAACRDVDETGLPDTSAEIGPYVASFLKWASDYGMPFTGNKWEELVYGDENLWVAGRLDLRCWVGADHWVIDLKATSELHEENQIQVAGYATLAEMMFSQKFRSGILHLTPRTTTKPYRFLEVTDPQAATLFTNAVKTYEERGNNE
jgi:hypothetical protein